MLTSPRRRHRCPPCGRTSVDAVIATSPCSTWNRHIRGERTWRPGRPGRPGKTTQTRRPRGERRHHPHHRTGGAVPRGTGTHETTTEFHVEHTGTLVVPQARAPGRPPAALDSGQGPDRRLTLHGRSPTFHAERPTRPRSVPRGTRAWSPQHAMSVSGRDPEQLTFQQLSRSRWRPSRVFHVKQQ